MQTIEFMINCIYFGKHAANISYLDHVFRKICQFGNVNAKTFVHNARSNLVHQCEYLAIGQYRHVVIFYGCHVLCQLGDLVEMGSE